jgi:hypothetical protein
MTSKWQNNIRATEGRVYYLTINFSTKINNNYMPIDSSVTWRVKRWMVACYGHTPLYCWYAKQSLKEFTSIHQNIKKKRETIQKLEGPVLIWILEWEECSKMKVCRQLLLLLVWVTLKPIMPNPSEVSTAPKPCQTRHAVLFTSMVILHAASSVVKFAEPSICWRWGSHSSDYKEFCLLGCDAV